MKWLSNVVREAEDDDYFKSKNLVSVNGMVTSLLRQDWHLNEAWADLVNYRFKRLNEITDSKLFGSERSINGHKVFIGNVPEEIDEDFSKKRIDHRHHALDALVVALTTQAHINYINNRNAKSAKNEIHQKLKNKLTFKRNNGRNYKLPFEWWENKPKLVYQGEIIEQSPKIKNLTKKALEDIIVSFKKNNKVATQATNKIEQWRTIDGKKTKVIVSQSDLKRENGNKKNWSVRKDIHEKTLNGRSKQYAQREIVDAQEAIEDISLVYNSQLRKKIEQIIKNHSNKNEVIIALKNQGIDKIEIYSKYLRTRYKGNLDSSFVPSKINKVSDPSIRNILRKHLGSLKYQNQKDDNDKLIAPEQLAFSVNGIIELNDTIKFLNYGTDHKPIYKVSLMKPQGEFFEVGEDTHKKKRFVKTAGSANVMCGVYEIDKAYGDRILRSPKIKDSIDAITDNDLPLESNFEEKNDFYSLRFILKPMDLVYVPTEEQIDEIKRQRESTDKLSNKFLENLVRSNNYFRSRIFVLKNISGQILRFEPHNYSGLLLPFDSTEKFKNFIKNVDNKEIKEKLIIKNELGGNSATSDTTRVLNQKSISTNIDIQIKDYCLKLNIDKLGRIKSIEL